MTNKEKYTSWAQNNVLPLFAKPQWLQAIYSHWDVVIYTSPENITYYMTYVYEKNKGLVFIRNPHLTPYVYIVSDATITIDSNIVEKLIQQLPKYDYLQIDIRNFNTKQTIASYTTIPKHTYILELTSQDAVYSNFKDALKRQIKKASKNLIITETEDIQEMFAMHQKSFDKQDIKSTIPLVYFKKVWNYCTNANCGTLFTIKDTSSNCHAMLLLVWDDTTSYYLIGGTDKQYYGSGAMSYLMWHAIQYSIATNKKIFDFEGSMIDAVATFFKKYAPHEVHYTSIEKNNSMLLRIYNALKK